MVWCVPADDLYSILCVPASASQSEIKAAYRRLVHDLHPDKAGQFGQVRVLQPTAVLVIRQAKQCPGLLALVEENVNREGMPSSHLASSHSVMTNLGEARNRCICLHPACSCRLSRLMPS